MIADKIMTWCWGSLGWDINSPAHKYWQRQVKKKKRSTLWWKQNWQRILEEDKMKCPICGQKLVCGCSHCLINFPAKEDEKYMTSLSDGYLNQCSNCGFTQSIDKWEDDSIKQLKEEGLWPL